MVVELPVEELEPPEEDEDVELLPDELELLVLFVALPELFEAPAVPAVLALVRLPVPLCTVFRGCGLAPGCVVVLPDCVAVLGAG
jgi:hypothetical protein